MRSNYYITIQKKFAKDTDGYLFLITKGRDNKKKRSLGIKVSINHFKKYWNEKEQRFRSGMPLYKQLNEEIDNAFQQLKNVGGIAFSNRKSKDSFLLFWQEKIDEIENHNTRIKIEVVKKKFIKYLTTLEKSDVKFSELNPSFIKGLQKYLKSAKDPKMLSSNTATHYLKIIKSFISLKLEDDPTIFIIHPFTGVRYDKREETERVVLQDDKIDILLNKEIETPRIDRTRDMFLFQLFAQGMRVSDLLLLRWHNIITDLPMPSNRNEYPHFIFFDEKNVPQIVSIPEDNPSPFIKYRMLKTNSIVEVPLTYNLCVILLKLIGEDEIIYVNYDHDMYLMKKGAFDIFDGHDYLSIPQMESILDDYCNKSKSETEIENLNYYKGYYFGNTYADTIKAIDFLEEKRDDAAKSFIKSAMYVITYHIWNNQCINDFVFPLLKNSLFMDVDSSNGWRGKLSLEQNKKLLNAETLYNRQLKDVALACGLVDNLISHAGRHSFVQLLLDEGAPTYKIMESLRHKSIATTDKYIKHKNFSTGGINYTAQIGNRKKYRKA